MMNDITTREDVIRIVDAFYEKVQRSDVIAHHFSSIDWTTHKPVMYSFWSTMLLGDQSYKRSPLAPHMRLNLTENDFNEWIRLFNLTMDELFSGSNAEELKARASSIAQVWKFKLLTQKAT